MRYGCHGHIEEPNQYFAIIDTILANSNTSLKSLSSKVFVVAAGASGIGLSTCRLLTERGACAVCIGDFNDSKFSDIQQELKSVNSNTTIEM